MKNYDDRLFVGNIIQRTLIEDRVVGPMVLSMITDCSVVKKNAVLYKTKNGGYVDIDVLNLEGLFAPLKIRQVDKIELKKGSKETSNGLKVMPAVSLSEENGHDEVLGQFVDADTLVSYNDFINNQSKEIETGESRKVFKLKWHRKRVKIIN